MLRPGGKFYATWWTMEPGLGAFPFHKTLFGAIASGKQAVAKSTEATATKEQKTEQKAEQKDSVADQKPAAPAAGPKFDTADELRAELMGINGCGSVRTADVRSSFTCSAKALVDVTLDNPGMKMMTGALAAQDVATFVSSMTQALLDATKATDVNEVIFLNASANLVIATKKE